MTTTTLPIPGPRTTPTTRPAGSSTTAAGTAAAGSCTAPNPPAVHLPAPVIDNRPVYLAWAGAWLVGHGATALAGGDDPVVAMPGWLPPLLLIAGVLAALSLTVVRSVADKRRMHGEHEQTAAMLGNAWVVGFLGLGALITGASVATGDSSLQSLLWPTGSALVVGMLYTAGGAAYRDRVQYALGTYLAVVGAAAVTLGGTGSTALLATVGVAGYLAAAGAEPRRVAAARTARRPVPVAGTTAR